MGRWYPLPSRLGCLGSVVSPGRKRIWGILSVAERLWLKENQVFRDPFVTAYTSARTVSGHQLAKTAPVHY